ncbi:MAG: PAS domain-containing protein [Dongiaceae bacterium]
MARPPADPAAPHARQRLVRILHEAKQRLIRARGMPTAARPDAGSGARADTGAGFASLAPARPGCERPPPRPAGGERPLVAETDILEAIAADLPLPDVLHRIALAVDALLPDAVCSILLLDPDGVHLRHGAAPLLPDDLNRTLDGQPIGPQAGSCGTAAFTGEPVVVSDIATDPRWDDYRHLVAGLGFRACWSTPVLDTAGRVLATFALYERTPKAPDDSEIETIASFAHLVGIAIERDRQREELRASEERFRTIYRSVPVSIWEEDWSAIIAAIDELRRQGVVDFRRHFADHPEIVAGMLASMHVLDVNDQTLRILGTRDRAELERKLKAGTLSTDVVGAFADQIATLAEGASIFEGERTFLHASGESISALMRIAYPAPDSGSGLVLVSLMDVTALKRLEAERASLAARLGATLENMTDAFCLIDRDGCFVYLNAEAARVLQRRREDLAGRSMWDVFPDARGGAIDTMYVEAMRDGTPRHMEYFYPQLGEWLDVRVFPSAEGLAIYFRVITERKELDEKLRLSEERFREIAIATTDVISDWDLATDTIWWGDGYARVFGYPPPDSAASPETWSARIHPDDREATETALRAAIENGERQWNGRYRFLHADGSALDIEDRVRILFDEDGTPVRMIGGMTDVTERRRLAAQLAESEERFRAIAGATSDIVWDWDLRSHRLWWADRVGQNGTYEGDAIDDHPEAWVSAVHPDDRERVVAILRDAIATRRERWTTEYRYRDGQGGWIDIEDHGRLIFDGTGDPVRVVGGMADITERKRLEARLAESEERFRIIARATADFVWDWDLRTQEVWWTDRVATAGIYPGSALESRPDEWTEAIHPDDRDRVVAALVGAIERREERWVVQYRYTDDKGGWIDVEDHGQLIFDADGEPVRMVGGMTDVTLRNRAEEALRQSEALAAIGERVGRIGGWALDLRSREVYWSRGIGAILEWTAGVPPTIEQALALYVERDRERLIAALDECGRSGAPFALDLATDTMSGRRIWVHVAAEAERDADGAIVRLIGAFQDITEKKRLDAQLRENEERFRLIADTAADRFWDWNLETGMLWWAGRDGGSGEADIGTAIGADLGDRIWGDRLHPDDRERVVTSFIDAIERHDRKWVEQYRYRNGDESWIELEDRGQLFFDANGKLNRFMGSMADITEKKRLDAQLRESEERFRIIARTTADVVWDWDLVAGTTWRSEGMYGRFGNPDGSSVSFGDWKARLHPDDRDRILAGLQETIDRGAGEWIDQYRFLDNRGKWIDIEDHGRIVLDETGKAVRFVGGMSDITARKRAERDLRERIKELDCLYRAVELTTVDERPIEAICADIAAILPGSLLHDDAAVARIVVDGREQHSAGWRKPVAALNAPIRVEDREVGFVEIGVTEARPDEKDGEGPFLREERALVNAVATHIARMIGDRRMAETLIQSERLRSVGELTGGVAHDFNNLLTIILGNAEILSERLEDRPDLRPLAETTMSAAERGAELTSRLLSFARRQVLEPAPTDLNRLVAGMDGMLRRTLGEQIEIEMRLGEGLRLSLVDAPRLENALLNLCINARDAMQQGGLLIVETRNVDLDADHRTVHSDVTPGRYVMVAVSDTGSGMAPGVLARAFDPFFTTKEVGKGSGLGLSMVYGFVKQSRGHVNVYSEPGQGTTVRLYLPEADGQAATDAIVEASPPPGGSEKILLVEDDDLVREHVRVQVETLGYRVVAVANGPDAVATLQADADFDLLFTDVVMPGGMNGRELADEARRIRPDLPVLFTSGYTEDAIMHHGRLDPGVHLLSKPYRRQELATKIRIALGD